MKMTRLLLFSLFVFSLSHYAGAQNRISITWEVMKYDIAVSLPQNYASDRNLAVVAKLRLKNVSSRAYSRVTLRISDQAEISSVSANGAAASFRKREESIGANRKLQRAVVSLPSTSPGTEVTVSVTYKLLVKSNSGLNALSPLGSQFVPLSFWYPTPNSWFFSGGSDFAPFKITVNNNSRSGLVSSGAGTGNSFDQRLNGQPFFVTGNWEKIQSGGVEVLAPLGLDANGRARAAELGRLLSDANAFVKGLNRRTDNYPSRIVSVSRGAGFSDSGTVFLDDSVFRRKKIDAQTAMILAESATKTWLGNSVEVSGIGFGVIREGLAKFIATQFLEQKLGNEIAEIERLRQRTNYSAIANRDGPLTGVSPLDGYYYTANANKGAMIWRFLSTVFKDDFYSSINSQAGDGSLTLNEIRTVFSARQDHLNFMLDKSTAMNLMVGMPQQKGSQTTVALRNVSEVPVSVDVNGTTSNGQKVTATVSVPANGFAEAVFRSTAKIVKAEVDPNKVFPQTEYFDDVAPREIDENDPILFIKRDYDRQRFEAAEKNARTVIGVYPRFDDARTLLARALLAQNKTGEANRIFGEVLDEKLPSARSLAWANVGSGDIAAKSGQTAKALEYYKDAILVDADYGATLAARIGRKRLSPSQPVDPGVKQFFTDFDAAVNSNSKARIDSLVLTGEITRFAGSVAAQAQEWNTVVERVDSIDPENAIVETQLSVRLLSRENESGKAVFKISKVDGKWKLSGVEIFEVR